MKEEALEFGRQLREDGNNNQKQIVQHAEENSCSRLPRVSNRRDADEGQIAMRQSKEVQQEVQSTKIKERSMQHRDKGPKSSEVTSMEIKMRRTTDRQELCASCCHNNLLLLLTLNYRGI